MEWLDHLQPEVRDFEYEKFQLAHDLQCIDQIYETEAYEGTIFYCGRIVEALTNAALNHIGETGPSRPFTMFSKLELLIEYQFLSSVTSYWSHALRRYGNHARHLGSDLTSSTVDASLAFLDRWLVWFFSTFSSTDRSELGSVKSTLPWLNHNEIHALLTQYEQCGFDPQVIENHYSSTAANDVSLRVPEISSALAQLYLDRGRRENARTIIRVARDRFPQETRLIQLDALLLSRSGQSSQAIALLNGTGNQSLDEEGRGILAGAYKRAWVQQPSDIKSLKLSHKHYLKGWTLSHRKNVYLGINAATSAFWLGNQHLAREEALIVQQKLRARKEHIRATPITATVPFSFWDQVTLGEAELLLGHFDQAKEEYREAFLNYSDLVENMSISKDQCLKILIHMGRNDLANDFFTE